MTTFVDHYRPPADAAEDAEAKRRHVAEVDTKGVPCDCGLNRSAFASRREYVEHRNLCRGT